MISTGTPFPVTVSRCEKPSRSRHSQWACELQRHIQVQHIYEDDDSLAAYQSYTWIQVVLGCCGDDSSVEVARTGRVPGLLSTGEPRVLASGV